MGRARLRRPRIAAIALAVAWPQTLSGAVTSAELVELSDIGGLAVSPEGDKLAFRVERARIDANNYVSDWYVADLTSGTVRRLGGGGTPIHIDPGVSPVERPVWSPDGSGIHYRALVDGAVELWEAPVDGSGARRTVRDQADIIAFGVKGEDGSLIYRVGPDRSEIRRAETEEYDAGIRLDASVDLAQALFRGAIINGRPASQRLVGRWFERAPLLWRSPLRTRRLDVATGRIEPSPQEGDLPLQGGAQAIGGGAVAISPAGREARIRREDDQQLIEVSAGEGRPRVLCNASQCRSDTLDWLAWHPSGSALVFASRDSAQRQSLHLWDVARDSVRTVARSDGLLSGSRDFWTPCAIGNATALCVAAGALSPPRLEAIDLATGRRTVIHDPNGGVRRQIALRADHLSWTAGAGHEFTGILLLPKSVESPLALFITYYGCDGFLRGGVGDEWPLASLAGAGIASLCINRTSTGILGSAERDNAAGLAGVTAIIDRLAADGIVDRARVGMGGFSFGAEVAMWTAFKSDLLAAVSVASPSLEPAYYWINGFAGRDTHGRVQRWWGLGDPAETAADWKRMSPALNIERIHAAVLMQLPEQEARLMPELIARLSRSATPAEFYVFTDEPHIKVQPRHKLAAYQRNLDWFRYWLQGYRDPDPAKASQFDRWDALALRAGGSAGSAPVPSGD